MLPARPAQSRLAFTAAASAVFAFTLAAPASAQADGGGPDLSYQLGEGVTFGTDAHEINLRGYTVFETVRIGGGEPDEPSVTDFRFLDLIGSLSLWDGRVSGVFIYDFENAVLPIENAKLDIRLEREGAPVAATVTVGNHKEPFSQQALNGSPHRILNEPALPQTLAPGRDVGVSLGLHTDRTTFAAGVFGENINAQDGAADGDGEWSLAARATHAPVLDDRDVVHFGASVAHERPGDRSVTFGPLPELGQALRPLITTDLIEDIDRVSRFGAEAAWRKGAFLAQAEWIGAHTDGAQNQFFHGAYANLSFALTGEARPYLVESESDQSGIFGALAPERPLSEGGWGAWELQGRISYLDLDSDLVRAGRQLDASAGIAWHPEANLRFDANGLVAQTWETLAPNETVTAFTLRASAFW